MDDERPYVYISQETSERLGRMIDKTGMPADRLIEFGLLIADNFWDILSKKLINAYICGEGQK